MIFPASLIFETTHCWIQLQTGAHSTEFSVQYTILRAGSATSFTTFLVLTVLKEILDTAGEGYRSISTDNVTE